MPSCNCSPDVTDLEAIERLIWSLLTKDECKQLLAWLTEYVDD